MRSRDSKQTASAAPGEVWRPRPFDLSPLVAAQPRAVDLDGALARAERMGHSFAELRKTGAEQAVDEHSPTAVAGLGSAAPIASPYAALRAPAGEATGPLQRALIADPEGEQVDTDQLPISELEYLVEWLKEEDGREADYATARADLERRRGTPRKEAVESFKKRYEALSARCPNLEIDISDRLNQMRQLATTYALEDNSDLIFSLGELVGDLEHLDDRLDNPYLAARANPARRRIADLLLFTSLIPVEESVSGVLTTEVKRLAIEVMSPKKLVAVVKEISHEWDAQYKELSELESFEGMDFEEGGDVLGQMLTLSLVNLSAEMRTEVSDTGLFKAIRDNRGVLGGVLLGSSGSDEQRYLNTCAASAVNQEVLSSISSIAGQVLMGRKIATWVVDRVPQHPGAAYAEETGHGLVVSQKVAQEVVRARLEFVAIEQDALALIEDGERESGPYHQLTQRWGKAMQRLVSVIDPSGGAAQVPVLTTKIIPNKWLLSAILAIPMGVDRPFRRATGLDADEYVTASRAVGLDVGDTPSQVLDVSGISGDELLEAMEALWLHVYYRNGTQFSVPGHALYVKAVRRGQMFFLIGDPKVDYYEPKSLEEMGSYVQKTRVRLPFGLN